MPYGERHAAQCVAVGGKPQRQSPTVARYTDAVSAPHVRMLYSLFNPLMRHKVVFGGTQVNPWQD